MLNYAPSHDGVLGKWGIATSILNLGTRWRWGKVSITPRPISVSERVSVSLHSRHTPTVDAQEQIYLSCSKQTPGWYLKQGHGRLLLHPMPFISYPNRIIRRYVVRISNSIEKQTTKTHILQIRASHISNNIKAISYFNNKFDSSHKRWCQIHTMGSYILISIWHMTQHLACSDHSVTQILPQSFLSFDINYQIHDCWCITYF